MVGNQYYQREDPDHVDSLDVQSLYGTMLWEDFFEMWNAKLEEVIDQYHPDIIWFDSGCTVSPNLIANASPHII